MKRALLALVVTASAAHADRISAGGKLRTKDEHVLGRDRTVDFVVAPDVARLVANTGTVDGTSLLLPAERYPQIAIVAALDANDALLDWLAVPLAGQARVKVETARGASVVLEVAGRRSAPLVATSGDLRIPVIVPPGVTSALAIATATNGNVTEKPIALGAHPFTQTLAICTAHGVSILAIDVAGAPATLVPPIAMTTGTAAARIRGPGWFEADVVADVADADAVEIAAGASLPSRCTITMPPLAPSSIRLVPDRTRYVAGGAPVELRVELGYRGARRRLAPAIEITTDTGAIATSHDSARWQLSPHLADKRTARARVVARWPGGALEGTVDIELAAAAPARLSIAPMPALRADGDTHADVVVQVVDAHGNPVPTATLRAHARGTVGAFARRADGAFVARYTAPRSRVATADRIEVEVVALDVPRSHPEALAAAVRVALEPLPRRFATSVRAGMLATTSIEVSPLVAATAEVRTPLLGDRIALGIDAGVTTNAFDVMATVATTTERVTGTVTAAPLLGRISLHGRRGNLGAWVGGGAGVAIVSTRIESASTGAQVDVSWRPAASGFAGASYRFGWGALGLELGYLHATMASDGDVHGALGGVTGALGYRVEL